MNLAKDRPDPLSALLASVETHVPPSLDRDAVLEAYSIVKGTPKEKVIAEATLLSGDLLYQQGIRDAARAFVKAGKKVYYYHWDYPNPFPVPFFGGVAHHFVDLLFIFQTLRDIYPNELAKKIAEDSGRYWVSFAAKGKPDGWREFNGGIVAVVDPEKGWVQRTEDEDRCQTPWRRHDRWDLIAKIQPYGQAWGDQMANRRDGLWKQNN
jgi:carboxylesterase type B